MRFALLGISHETNTFSEVPADYASFERTGIDRREEILTKNRNSNYTIAGYMKAAEEFAFDLVPLMYAVTGPIGTITSDAYDRLTQEMFGMLRDQGPRHRRWRLPVDRPPMLQSLPAHLPRHDEPG